MILSRISQISIPVGDQSRALDFYTSKLGCKLTQDVPMNEGGERWIEVEIPGAETHLVLYATPEQRSQIGSFSNIMFSSTNLSQTYRALQANDVEVVQPPTTEFWGSFLIFKDPDGNSFLVAGPIGE